MAVRVNTVSIGASATSASAYSATIPADGSMGGAGTAGIIAGDLIVCNGISNGTHVANALSVQDNVNTTNFTNIKEQQLGGASAYWQQCLYYVAAANVPAGSLITFTPFAAATFTCFSIDVYRYALGTINQAVVGTTIASGTSLAASALGAAPPIGSLVLSSIATVSGTLTPGGAFTAGSQTNSAGASAQTANAYVIGNGTSTYADTWTSTATTVAAGQVVSFTGAGVGVPYLIGSHAQAAGSTTNVVTVGSGGGMSSIANDALFCLVGCGGGGTTAPTGVTDTKSHTWTQIASTTAANGMCCWIYQTLHAVTPITSGGGDTVTVTFNNGTYATNCEVIGCAGINQTTALDLVKATAGSGTAPTATTDSNLTNNNELVLAVITSGYATAGITWSAGVTAMDAGLRSAGGVYTSVGTKVALTTSPAQMGAALGAAGVWADLMVTLLPDPPTGAPATITITNTSPLTAGQVGVAYSNQLNATGGSPPYTWSVSAGALPGGLTLEPGGGGGASGDFQYVGVNTGPQGAPTVTAFNNNYALIGPNGAYKVFFSSFPTTWVGTLMESITQSKPGTFTYICWNDTPSQTVINNFAKTIPTSVQEVGFCWNSEPENTGGSGLNVSSFQSGWLTNMTRVHNARSVTPVKLTTISTSYLLYYQQGGSNAWIPPTDTTDVYGFDFYDRKVNSAGADMSSTHGWQVWTGYVKNLGKPLAITEFGLSGWGTDAAQNQRLQADLAYLKNAFGPGGTVSQLPLYIWLYWGTGLGGGGGTINDFLGPATEATWKGIAGTQSGSGGGSTGGGGLIVGTPTTTAGSPFSFTAKATDTAAAFGTKAFSLTVNSSSALAITTTSPLPGGTVGVAYSNMFTASGGTAPYTWSLQSGTWPAGLSISGQLLTGTPSTPGTSTPTLKVTDNVAATATLAVSITISAAVSVTTATLPAGTVGSAYSVSLAATGGTTPYTWQLTAGVIPDGLVLDSIGGTISGTPTTPGAPVLQFQVIDSAGATALSPQMPLSIALATTGGLPVIGRRRFGGGQLDVTFSYSGANWVKAAGVTLTFWTALTGGSQVTDLTTIGGGAITTVTSDSNGFIGEFFGPAGTWKMAADANAGAGPRAWIIANDVGDEVSTLWSFLKPLSG